MLDLPIAFVRAAWFMENAIWDVPSAREGGAIQSFLQPLDHAIPMVATADIGATTARLLQERWVGRRVVELQGPAPVSPNELAAVFGRQLGRSVTAHVVPRAMGGAVPYAGHAEPDATHANARWLQSGLAFVRGW
jgi:NAD(P)H dehydrogenase (quinone)